MYHSHNYINSLEDKYGSPFYLMYPEVFRDNINNFRNALLKHYDKVLVGYSFKTSYIPAIAGLAMETGCWAEVVSGMEYEMALKLGFDPKEIIFNGPVKRREEIYRALELGSVVNLDSWYEVEDVIEYKKQHGNKTVKVGLRINMNLSKEGGESAIQLGLRTGRFGFSEAVLEKTIPLLKQHDIIINSLHGHTSSSNRAVDNYIVITNTLLKVAEKYELNLLEYFNIGGGFFGAAAKGIDITGKPTYQDYADAVMKVVLNNTWFKEQQPVFVIEPGVSVVANVFTFVTKIFEHKVIGDKEFIVVDGSVFDVKPSMHSLNLPFTHIQKDSSAGKDTRIVVDVVGSTCMEKDIILSNIEMQAPQVGDYICFDGVGAYTHNFTPTFINYKSPIIAFDGDNETLIRRRQNIDGVLASYKLD